MGFETLNTFKYRRFTLPSFSFHLKSSKHNIQPLRANNTNDLVYVPYSVVERIKPIIDDEGNCMLKLTIVLDYIYNSILNEILQIQHLKIREDFTQLIEEKTPNYYCLWDDMIKLIQEHTRLRFVSSSTSSSSKSMDTNMISSTSITSKYSTENRTLSTSTNSSQTNTHTSSYYATKMKLLIERSKLDEEKYLISSSSSGRIETLYDYTSPNRIDFAMKQKGFAIEQSKPWDTSDDDSDNNQNNQNLVQELIQVRKTPLTSEEVDQCNQILNGRSTDEVIVSKFGFQMTRNKLLCLRPGTWLNDEVINFYMQLLQIRDNQLCEKYPNRRKSYFFSSFFMQRLLEDNHGYHYPNIKRWSKKFDIFELDKAFFPINLGNSHWALGVVYMQKKEVHYYDSMNGSGMKYLDAMIQWIVDEGKEKKGNIIHPNHYKKVSRHPTTPQQSNGVDCGVFTTICADFVFDDLPIQVSSYHQNEMPFYRKKILADILRGHLLYPIKCLSHV